MDLKLPCALAVGFLGGAALFGRMADPVAADDVPAPTVDEATRRPPSPAPEVVPLRDVTTSRHPVFLGASTPTPTENLHGMVGETVTARWRAQVQAWIESEGFLERLDESPTEMGDLLLEILLTEADAAGAERLLREMPDTWMEQWIEVAELNRTLGDVEHAADLYLEALRRWTDEEELVDPLLELAPERALAFLESRSRDYEIDVLNEEEYRALAVFLHHAGRLEEAHAVLVRLDEAGELDDRCLLLLGELDPDLVERRLRARTQAEGACGTYLQNAHWMLLDHLERQGRIDEVTESLLANVEHGQDTCRTHAELVRLAPERWAEVLRTELETLEETEERAIARGRLGDCELALGNEEKAVDCWLSADEETPYGGASEWAYRALELAPDRTLFRLEPRVRAEDDDESWGEFGDMCWMAGRSMQAVAAWRRARELDPQDGEWFDRLERISLDEDPLPADEIEVWWTLTEAVD